MDVVPASSGGTEGRVFQARCQIRPLICTCKFPTHRGRRLMSSKYMDYYVDGGKPPARATSRWDRRLCVARAVADGGVLRGINTATKYAVAGSCFGILFLLPTDEVAWALSGSVAAAIVNKVLKRILNHERPGTARKRDPGMPSSHAQSLAFLSTYAALVAPQWAPSLPPGVMASACILLAGALASLRVVVGYHTWPQVLVGFCLGVFNASAWHRLGQDVLLAAQGDGAVRNTVWMMLAVAVALVLLKVAKDARDAWRGQEP